MSEAKMIDEEERLAQLPQVQVLRVDISPNPTHISDELNLEVDFTVSKTVRNGHWEVQYLLLLYIIFLHSTLYLSLTRSVAQLGSTDMKDYSRGENHFQFSVGKAALMEIDCE
ncbi:hypothetical protein THRCLA_20164 [Thraustotheca clavata]|uniref:Uncharacterized protein n=1 Tax=Thraustotheca clavata TaxID=74557 RepID=A0A1W0AAV2_9STRA|nr:hypothetical protein THRCLA_20164 [Thraustotheca clavata]